MDIPNLQIFGEYVIVKIIYLPNTITHNGVIVGIKTEADTYFTGEIISVGDEIKNKKIKVGEKVLVKSHTGQKVYYLETEDDYVKFHESDIIGILNKGENIDLTPYLDRPDTQ